MSMKIVDISIDQMLNFAAVLDGKRIIITLSQPLESVEKYPPVRVLAYG